MRLQPRGYEGTASRIQELATKLGIAQEKRFGSEQAPQSMDEAQASIDSPLLGSIGGTSGGGQLPAIKPMNPFANGMEIDGKKAAPEALKGLIEKAATKASIDPNLLDAVVAMSSNYNPELIGKGGKVGLMQLPERVLQSFGVANSSDPAQHLEAGSKLLSGLIGQNGNLHSALRAYAQTADKSLDNDRADQFALGIVAAMDASSSKGDR